MPNHNITRSPNCLLVTSRQGPTIKCEAILREREQKELHSSFKCHNNCYTKTNGTSSLVPSLINIARQNKTKMYIRKNMYGLLRIEAKRTAFDCVSAGIDENTATY